LFAISRNLHLEEPGDRFKKKLLTIGEAEERKRKDRKTGRNESKPTVMVLGVRLLIVSVTVFKLI